MLRLKQDVASFILSSRERKRFSHCRHCGCGATGAVLVLGFANLIADGISMGYGDFLSSTAEKEFSANQQLIADWEVENDIHGEMMELVSAYQEQGMEKEDADKVGVFLAFAVLHFHVERSSRSVKRAWRLICQCFSLLGRHDHIC